MIEKTVDQMNVGRSYPIWDSFLDEKLNRLQISTDVKQEVLMLDDSFDREESAPGNEFYCRTCSLSLSSREEQIDHYKSDKHRKSLVNRLRSRLDSTSSTNSTDQSGVDDSDQSEDEDLDDTDSDWSDDESREVASEQLTSVNHDDSFEGGKGRARQEIQFYNSENDRISFFRAMVASRSEYLNDLEIHRRFVAVRDCFLNKGDITGDRYDAVLLFAVGAFAGAVFINGEPVVHKVIKKYVVRAKQGKAQSTNDLRTKAKSAGAQIRRHNEKVLMEKITAQIKEWGPEYLSKCRTIFVRAPKHQKHVMLQPLHQIVTDKLVVRPCPCPMHKPRFKEVVRMFQKIFSVKVLKRIEEGELTQIRVQAKNAEHREILQWKKMERERKSSESEQRIESEKEPVCESAGNPIEREQNPDSPRKKKKSRKPAAKQTPKQTPSQAELKLLEEAEELFREKQNEIYTAIRSNDAGKLDRIIQNYDKDGLAKLLNEPIKSDNRMTFLHLAAEMNSVNSIQVLLAHGCDPSLRNTSGSVPFRLCSERCSRAAFWEFRAQQTETNPEKNSKKFWAQCEIPDPATISEPSSEKSKARKRPKKKKSITKVNEEIEKKPEEVKKVEKKNPCDDCGSEITDVPFKYADFKFCTTSCLRAHRFSNLNK